MGRLHVDDMLAEMTPEEFDRWWAADLLDPLDDSWRQAGEICATIYNTMLVANSTEKVTQDDLRLAEEYIPRPKFLPLPRRESTKPELTKAASAKRYGPTR